MIPPTGTSPTKHPARPFLLDGRMRAVVQAYPSPRQFLDTARAVSPGERLALVRLWLTEGIPFVFKDCPALYEAIRGWLAQRIGVHAKHVTMIGSGRIGFSLAPGSRLGSSFGPTSDLDFSAVSGSLFTEVADAFARWADD